MKNEKDLISVLNQLKQKIAEKRPVVLFRNKIQKFYLRAAAILLLPLLHYSVYSTNLLSDGIEITFSNVVIYFSLSKSTIEYANPVKESIGSLPKKQSLPGSKPTTTPWECK